MIEKFKSAEIDLEKGICRINGKELEHTSYLKIEYNDGEWDVVQTTDIFFGAKGWKFICPKKS